MRWIPDRPKDLLAPALGILGVLLLLLACGLSGQHGDLIGAEGDDLTTYFYSRSHAMSCLRAGQFPTWNPFLFCGTPFAANPESGLFYPPNILFLFLGIPAAFNISLILHFWLTGFLAFVLARRLGCSRAPAVMAGVVFMLCGANFPHVQAGHISDIDTVTWLPLLASAVESLLCGGGWSAIRMGAMAGSLMLLGGHLQYCVFSAYFVLIYAGLRLWIFRAGTGPGNRGPILGRIAMTALLALALAGIQLGLTAGILEGTSRGHPTPRFAGYFSLPFVCLSSLFLPRVTGPAAGVPYWGPLGLCEDNAYLGLIPLMLVVLAMLSIWSRRSPITDPPGTLDLAKQFDTARSLAVAGLCCLVLAFGKYTFLFGTFCRFLPFLVYFRGWCKFLLPASLCWSLLAGLGLHWWTCAPELPIHRKRIIFLVTGVMIAFAIVAAVPSTLLMSKGNTPEGVARFIRTHLAFQVLRAIAVLGAGALLLGTSRKTWAVVIVVVLDLCQCNRLQVSLVPSENFKVPGRLAESIDTRNSLFRTFLGFKGRANMALLAHIRHPLGYETLNPDGLAALMNAANEDTYGEHHGPLTFRKNNATARLVTRLMSIAYLFDPQQVQSVPGAIPRACLFTKVKVFATRGEVWETIRSASFDPASELLISLDGMPAPAIIAAPPPRSTGARVRIIDDRATSVRISTSSPTPAFLYLSDSFSPGWTATVDRAPVAIYRANCAFRAVPVPSGDRIVTFTYTPPLLREGAAINVLGIILLLGSCWADRRAR